MSFTSTPSVRPRTVLALVVELFSIRLTSMENILQSLVKIIIIGSIYTTKNVEGNRQFLPPPPLPYYQNEGFYLPGFVPSYHEPLPVYYRHHNPPPAVSYQNINSYSSPQLFHQNDNYNPTQFPNPNLRYSVPQLPPYKPNTYQVYKKNDFGASQGNQKLPSVVQSPVEGAPKKQAFYATNIIVKEESQSPFYQDDYNKNYQEEDYADNYSDEPSQPEPCVQGRYRYFESSAPSPNEKLTLCNPYFQPNFGNSVYTVKMPITLLPSRFPPRVEQLIERIQNYFSTYTQQETPKPQNETSVTTTVGPVTETTSGGGEQTTLAMIDQDQKNRTTVTEELNVEDTSPESVGETTIGTVNEQVTQKTIVVYVEPQDEETFSTAAPESEAKKELQVTTEKVPSVGESTKPTIEHLGISEVPIPKPQAEESEKSSEIQISNELLHSGDAKTENPEMSTQSLDVKSLPPTTEMWTKREENSSVQPTEETLLQVTDTNG